MSSLALLSYAKGKPGVEEMPVFNDHEMIVLSNALSRIHLIYSFPHHSCCEDKLSSRAIRMVFRARFPEIQADQNIMVTFGQLMDLMYNDMRAELAAWYIDEQGVTPPPENCGMQRILEFAIHLTVISDILKISPPETKEQKENTLRLYLLKFWDQIHENLFDIYK